MIKILTFNLNYYGDKHGPWASRKELVRKAVETSEPDIVAFQAVSRDPRVEGGLDQASQIGLLLPRFPYVFYQPAEVHKDNRAAGSAIVSSIPMVGFDSQPLTRLPKLDDTSQRVIIKASFDLPYGPFHVFNGHFSWVTEQARRNIAEALSYINTYMTTDPMLLVGDLNTPPDSELFNPLREQGWVDVWAHLHPTDPGLTFFENGQMAKRIDYAWARNIPLEQICEAQVVDGQGEEPGLRASDHNGLLVSLDL